MVEFKFYSDQILNFVERISHPSLDIFINIQFIFVFYNKKKEDV